MTDLSPLLDSAVGAAKGVGDGVAGMVQGVGDLAAAGYHLATDPAAREAFARGAEALQTQADAYAAKVGANPARVLGDAKALSAQAQKAYQDGLAQAQSQGVSEAEYNGRLAGRGAFEVAALLAPLAKVAEAGKVADATKASEALADAEKANATKMVGGCPAAAAKAAGAASADDAILAKTSTPVANDAKNVAAKGTLAGTPTEIPPLSDTATARALNLENESALTLSQNGYNVVQNPIVDGPKNPDYLVNGEIFDNYAPSTSNIRNIASTIEGKVTRGQALNIVVNLRDSAATPAQIQQQINKYPISGLNKIIIIDKSGVVTEIFESEH